VPTASPSSNGPKPTPSTTSNQASIPEYIAPNINAIIPDSSSLVFMKFNHISYPQMVQDAILTAQFVQTLPVLLSKSLGITADDVIVVTITSASAGANASSRLARRRAFAKRDDNTGLVVSIAIPTTEVDDLQNLISQRNSALYSSDNGQLATLIDSNFPIRGNGK
jgi:hypothetical protein